MVYEWDYSSYTHHCYSSEENEEKAIDVAMDREQHYKKGEQYEK